MSENENRYQFIHVTHHNMSKWNREWWGKGQCVLMVYKIHAPDGTSRKRVRKVEDPKIRFYMTAPEFRAEHTLEMVAYPLEKCDEYELSIETIDREVAQLTGAMDYYNETKGPGANKRRRLLHANRWLHGSDANVADHYIDRFIDSAKERHTAVPPLEMAFSDCEVDTIEHVGFPDEFVAPCPISTLQYFYAPTKALTIFALRNLVRENPQIAEFENNLPTMLAWIFCEVNRAPLLKVGLITEETTWEEIAELYDLYDDMGGPNPDALAVQRCNSVDVRFYDEELEMIRAYLDHINEVDRPDTIAFWNMSFDVNTIINRIRHNGGDPAQMFTPKDFRPWCMANYNVDNFHAHPTDKSDIFDVSSYTIWVDQMLTFAQLRKTNGKRDSYRLDDILEEEIGENKLDYEGKFRDFIYTDYPRFILYGALDVVPLHTLEQATDDISQTYQLSVLTRTRFHKVLKKTTCLRNLANVYYRDKRQLAISNNRNRLKERTIKEKFRGAWIADPKLMDYTGILIDGVPSNRVFDDAVDVDASSLYPSIKIAFNIDVAAQIGRLVLFDEDGNMIETSELIESWSSGDLVEIGSCWLQLPNLSALDMMLKEIL